MKPRRKDKQHGMLEHDFTSTKTISENVPKHAIGIELFFCFERFSSLCSSEHLPAAVVFCAIPSIIDSGAFFSLFSSGGRKSDRESRDGLKFNNKKRFENPITIARLFRHSDDYHKANFMTTLIIEFASRTWSCVENGRIACFLARGDKSLVFLVIRGHENQTEDDGDGSLGNNHVLFSSWISIFVYVHRCCPRKYYKSHRPTKTSLN